MPPGGELVSILKCSANKYQHKMKEREGSLNTVVAVIFKNRLKGPWTSKHASDKIPIKMHTQMQCAFMHQVNELFCS